MTADNNTQKMDVYSSVRWSAFSKYGAQGMQLVISLVMARLLAPEYFGLLGMATVITGFVSVFTNLGFASAIVQRKEVSDDLLSTLFWVNLGICVLVGGVVLAIAPLAAWMYDDPRVTPIIAVLSVNFLLSGFAMIPAALLQRRMEFKKLALREIGGVVTSACVAIPLAYFGWGVWALVMSSLATSATQVILINLAIPFRPRMIIDRQGLRECLGFGLNITGAEIFRYLARNSDNLIIGIFLGPVALGYYAFAYKLMLLPRNAITRVVTRVLLPVYSRMQNDDERLSNAYLRASAAIAFVTFPMMVGFAVVAEPFVQVVLGERWLPAVPIIWLLAPIGAIQSVGSTRGQLLIARGRSDWVFRLAVFTGTLRVLSFFAGIPWGVIGVAAAYAILSLFLVPLNFWITCKLIEPLTMRRIMNTLSPYWVSALIMGTLVLVTQMLLTWVAADPWVILTLSVFIGLLSYTALSVVTRPVAFAEIGHLLPARLVMLRFSKRPRYRES